MATASDTAGATQPSGSMGWSPYKAAAVTLGSSPVLRFGVPGALGVMYDEPHEVLLVVAEQKVYAWRLPREQQGDDVAREAAQGSGSAPQGHSHEANPGTSSSASSSLSSSPLPHQHPPSHAATASAMSSSPSSESVTAPAQVFEVPPGPVMAVRFSLDGRILAVQRSLTRIDMLLRSTTAPAAALASTAARREGTSATSSSTAEGHTATVGGADIGSAAAAADGGGAAAGAGAALGGASLQAANRGEVTAASSSSGSGGSASADGGGCEPEVPATPAVPVHEYRCRAGERILGFFWTDCPSCDLVVVTSNGPCCYRVRSIAAPPSQHQTQVPSTPSASVDIRVQLVEVQLQLPLQSSQGIAAAFGSMALSSSFSPAPAASSSSTPSTSSPVSWFLYSHVARVLLMAGGGPSSHRLQAMQFSSSGVVLLPPFSALLSQPQPPSQPPNPPPSSSPAHVLGPQHVRIVSLYGSVYCLQTDPLSCHVHVFRLFRDAVTHEASIPVPSPTISISVIDNLLVLHSPSHHLLLLFDVASLSSPPSPSLSHPPSSISANLKPAFAFPFFPSPSPAYVATRHTPSITAGYTTAAGYSSSATSSSLSSTIPLRQWQWQPLCPPVQLGSLRHAPSFPSTAASASASAAASAAAAAPAPELPVGRGMKPSSDQQGIEAATVEEGEGEGVDGRTDGEANGWAPCEYEGAWAFLLPDLLLDHDRGLLWRLRLNVQAITGLIADTSLAISFLHRRHVNPSLAHALAISRFASLLSSSDSRLPHIYAAMAMLLSPLAGAAATARKAAARAGRGEGRGEGTTGTGSMLGSEEESEEEKRKMGAAVSVELDALAAWKGVNFSDPPHRRRCQQQLLSLSAFHCQLEHVPPLSVSPYVSPSLLITPSHLLQVVHSVFMDPYKRATSASSSDHGWGASSSVGLRRASDIVIEMQRCLLDVGLPPHTPSHLFIATCLASEGRWDQLQRIIQSELLPMNQLLSYRILRLATSWRPHPQNSSSITLCWKKLLQEAVLSSARVS